MVFVKCVKIFVLLYFTGIFKRGFFIIVIFKVVGEV